MYTFTKADSDSRFQVSGGDPLLTDDRQIERRIEKLQQGRGKGELDRTGLARDLTSHEVGSTSAQLEPL